MFIIFYNNVPHVCKEICFVSILNLIAMKAEIEGGEEGSGQCL